MKKTLIDDLDLLHLAEELLEPVKTKLQELFPNANITPIKHNKYSDAETVEFYIQFRQTLTASKHEYRIYTIVAQDFRWFATPPETMVKSRSIHVLCMRNYRTRTNRCDIDLSDPDYLTRIVECLTEQEDALSEMD